MAANYWTSTQYQFWTFTPENLAAKRDELAQSHIKLIQMYPYPDRRLMFIFFRDRLLQLAKRLQYRQQCVATALVYLHRYFLTVPMQSVNIYLLVATAFYLSSKTEEAPHHITRVAPEARQAWPDFVPGDMARLGEMEFCLISEMRSQLIVWHPYRSLIALKENSELKLTNEELGLAWSIINDSYMTDLPLVCPPHMIAIMAMFLAVVFLPTAKATDGLRSLAHESLLSPEAGAFSSLSGRAGMSAVFSQALGNFATPVSMPPTNAQAFGSNNSLQRPQPAEVGVLSADRDKTLTAIKNSEKIQALIRYLVQSDFDLEQLVRSIQSLISLYEIWEQYNEKSLKETIARCIKTQGLDL